MVVEYHDPSYYQQIQTKKYIKYIENDECKMIRIKKLNMNQILVLTKRNLYRMHDTDADDMTEWTRRRQACSSCSVNDDGCVSCPCLFLFERMLETHVMWNVCERMIEMSRMNHGMSNRQLGKQGGKEYISLHRYNVFPSDGSPLFGIFVSSTTITQTHTQTTDGSSE